MKRVIFLVIGLVIALPIVGWMKAASAQTFRSGNDVTISPNQVIHSTLFAAGKTVNITGTVDGDVFCAGQQVNITATVNGDVICTGQDISISGLVTGDVRAAGENVTLGGMVRNNASVASQSLVLDSRGRVGRDLSAVGGTVDLNGTVGRDAAISATDVHINKNVGRNLQASATHLSLGSAATIGGNITYTSHNPINREHGSQVQGSITHHVPASHHNHYFIGWLFALYLFVSLLLAALVLVLLLPRVFEHSARLAAANRGKTFLTGLAASILMPIIMAVVAATIIGMPLAFLAGIAWLLALLLATPFAAYLLGSWLIPQHRNPVLVMLLGATILFLLYLLPILGFIVWLVASWFGLGMILRQLIWRIGRPHYDMANLQPSNSGKPKIEQRAESS